MNYPDKSTRRQWRHPLRWLPVFLLLWATIVLGACQSHTHHSATQGDLYYTCPMHAQVHENKPGNCPICGMALIKMSAADEDSTSLDTALAYLTQPVTQTVVGSFKVITPISGKLATNIAADGIIDFDQRYLNTVNTQITSRIEKLYVTYTNQQIHKGQPLMTIYSPQLVSAQRDLLQAATDNDKTLTTALKSKLINLGMTADEVARVLKMQQPLTRITIYSPYDGISQPIANMAPKNNEANMSSMNSMTGTTDADKNTQGPALLNLREGMYINAGQTVFSIQDISHVWAILNITGDDIAHVHTGDAVHLYADANPNDTIPGQVDFIPPYHEDDEKTTRVRVYVHTLPPNWKIGTLIHGIVQTNESNNRLLIPLTAINKLGRQNIVWVQDKKHSSVFHARQVHIGLQTNDSIQITEGIQAGEKIAADASYMVDSDSFTE